MGERGRGGEVDEMAVDDEGRRVTVTVTQAQRFATGAAVARSGDKSIILDDKIGDCR